MTFDDDFILVEGGRYSVANLGLSWPPPETLRLVFGSPSMVFEQIVRGVAVDASGVEYRRLSHSAITDEDRAGMTHVARGAEYLSSAGEVSA